MSRCDQKVEIRKVKRQVNPVIESVVGRVGDETVVQDAHEARFVRNKGRSRDSSLKLNVQCICQKRKL